MFKRINNILSNSDHNQLESKLNSFEFDWHYLPGTVPPNVKQLVSETNTFIPYESEQFIHLMYDQKPLSPYWSMVKPILDSVCDKMNVKILEIGRIKTNMLIKNQSKNTSMNCPHVDRDTEGYHSMVYYVNDSDGDTILFNKKGHEGFEQLEIQDKAKPKKNTAVLFESDWYHTSTNPIDNARRIVLNFIFKIKND